MTSPTFADAVKLFIEANKRFVGTDDVEEARRFFQEAKRKGVINDFEEYEDGIFELAVPLQITRLKAHIRLDDDNENNAN